MKQERADQLALTQSMKTRESTAQLARIVTKAMTIAVEYVANKELL